MLIPRKTKNFKSILRLNELLKLNDCTLLHREGNETHFDFQNIIVLQENGT